jgi:hypothetical protein
MTTLTVNVTVGVDGQLISHGATVMLAADAARLTSLMRRGDARSPGEHAELTALSRTLKRAVATAKMMARLGIDPDTAFVVE